MPVCDNCNTKWSWIETIKKTTTLNPKMTCPYCGEKQYQTQASKNKGAILLAIILMPLFLQIFFDIPIAILFSLFPILFVLAMLFYPYVVELSSEEKYINFYKNEKRN